MTDAVVSLSPGPATRSAPWPARVAPLVSRALLMIVVAASVAVSLHVVGSDASARVDPDLRHLLRFMAALKAVLALAAFAAVLWRLAAPVTPAGLAAYAIASSVMAAGPGLIWGMDHVGLGALLLHGGLLASVVLLWRDPSTSARLKQAVEAARSKARRH